MNAQITALNGVVIDDSRRVGVSQCMKLMFVNLSSHMCNEDYTKFHENICAATVNVFNS
jgi:hypothetical protein